MSKCCETPVGLAALGDNPAFVVTAYLCAFFPWGILYALDFISNRWHTVRHTRRSGYFHLISSFPPLIYVVFYTHVQRAAGDYKEMSAAIAAIMLTLIHIARTLWGLVQLQAFKDWCVRALACTERMGCFPLVNRKPFDDYMTSVRKHVDTLMRVNETLIDNEFTETDLPVSVQIPKRGLVSGIKDILRGKTEDWLYCKTPVRCHVRWIASFLCQFGSDWSLECRMDSWNPFSGPAAKFIQIQAFLQVTANIPSSWPSLDGSGSDIGLELQSFLQPLHHFLYRLVPNMQDHVFPYGNVLEKGLIYQQSHQKFNLSDAINSYDIRALDHMKLRDERIIEDITLANVQAFMALLDEHRDDWSVYQAHVEESSLWTDLTNDSIPVAVLFAQLGYPEGTDLDNILNGIPIPKNLCSSLLWSAKTNTSLLQVSAHVDNLVAIEAGLLFKDVEVSPTAENLKPHEIFYMHKKMEAERNQLGYLDNGKEYRELDPNSRARHFGCIMETVRSLLAEWLVSTSKNGIGVDWTPIISDRKFEFKCSGQLAMCLYKFPADLYANSSVSCRILWECQYNLQTALASGNHDPDLPRSVELIMLFILGFPALRVTMDETVGEHREGFIISAVHGPQDIDIKMECNPITREAFIHLVTNSKDGFFHWENWKNAAKGRICGQYMRLKETVTHPETLVRMPDVRFTNISKPIVHISVPRRELVELKKNLWYWIGWPPMYPRIACFERDQLILETNLSSVQRTDVTTNIEMGSPCEMFKKETLQVEKALNEIGSVFDDNRMASGTQYALFKELEMAVRAKGEGADE